MSKKLPYSRADRVATEIHQVLAPYIHDCLSDPRVAGVQVTHVKVARDLRLARIYFFLRGTAAQRQDCHDGLEHAAGKMKQQLGDQMSLRYMPALEFHFDETIEQGERIDDLLQVIHDHDEDTTS